MPFKNENGTGTKVIVGDSACQPRREKANRIAGELGDFIATIAKNHGLNITDMGMIKYDANITLWVEESQKRKYFIKMSKYGNLAYEAFWCRKAMENGISVPGVLVSDFSKRQIPFMYSIMEFIDGVDLDAMQDKTERKKAAILAGMELRKLHAIKTDGFGVVNAAGEWSDKSWPKALERFMGIAENVEESATILFTAKELSEIASRIFSAIPIGINSGRLLSCDAQPQNIMYVGPQDKIILIDPKKIIGGDPMFDLARSRIPLSTDPFHGNLMDGYQMLGKLNAHEKRMIDTYYLACLFYAANSSYRNRARYGIKYKKFRALLDNLMRTT